jgi:hypothetical protein
MKGRSPWNNPTHRKADIYKIIVKAGGEARWKTLKTHLKELYIGPTTLKQTLDNMIEEKSIIKEARLGQDGAEIWYKTSTNIKQPKKPLLQSLDIQDTIKKYEAVKEKASRLDGKERESYLFEEMQKIVQQAARSYVEFVGSFARLSQFNGRTNVAKLFDYDLNEMLLNDTRAVEMLLSDYPSLGLYAVNSYLIEDKTKLERAMQREKEYCEAMLSFEKPINKNK